MSVLATIDIEGLFSKVDGLNALANFLSQSDARVNFNGTIRFTVEDHVADVRFVRTDKMNAIDGDMLSAINETIEAIDADPNIRCVVAKKVIYCVF